MIAVIFHAGGYCLKVWQPTTKSGLWSKETVCLPACQPACVLVCLSVCRSVSLPVHMPHLLPYLPVCLFVRPSVYLPDCRSACLSVRMSAFLSVLPSACLITCPPPSFPPSQILSSPGFVVTVIRLMIVRAQLCCEKQKAECHCQPDSGIS